MPRLLLLALLLVGAVGCGSPERSGSLPPLSASVGPSEASASAPVAGGATLTASPAPLPPLAAVAKPPEADQLDRDGAAAFARYWFAELNAAQESLDPSRLVGISDLQCQTCQAYIRSLRHDAQEGDRYSGGHVRVRETVTAPFSNSEAEVLVNVDDEELLVYGVDGRISDTVPADSNATLSFEAKAVGKGWLASEIIRQ